MTYQALPHGPLRQRPCWRRTQMPDGSEHIRVCHSSKYSDVLITAKLPNVLETTRPRTARQRGAKLRLRCVSRYLGTRQRRLRHYRHRHHDSGDCEIAADGRLRAGSNGLCVCHVPLVPFDSFFEKSRQEGVVILILPSIGHKYPSPVLRTPSPRPGGEGVRGEGQFVTC